MDIRMVCSDLDGTLMLADHWSISEKTREQLLRMAEKGIPFVPTTGRSILRLPGCLREGVGVRYAITANGGQVWDLEKNEVIFGRYFERDLIYRLMDYCDGLDIPYEVYRRDGILSEKRNIEKYMQGPSGIVAYGKFLEAYGVVDSIRAELDRDFDQIHKFQFPFLPVERVQALWEEFSTWEGLSLARSAPHNLELATTGTSKLLAIQFLCEYLHIDIENVAAFGDSINDIEMLQGVGVSVAMGNGAEAAKQAAKYCTLSNTEDGVAVMLEKLVP